MYGFVHRAMNPKGPSPNLLELKPTRNLEWETDDENKVVLFVPKFTSRFAVRWFVPLLAKPTMRVKLDERGSFVWQRCDGNTTVQAIGEKMSVVFTEPVETTYERIGKFIQQMVHNRFLLLDITT